MKRIAIILCGQLRNIDFCIQTMHEYLFPYYHCDIFCVTQDCNAVKPRIYTTKKIVNQYIFFPIEYDIKTKLSDLFKTRLKKHIIRKDVYTQNMKDRQSDLVANNIGWADNFKEMQMALDLAFEYSEANNITYDFFLKIRPDICFCKPFNKLANIDISSNVLYVNNKHPRFIWDAVFAMDIITAKYMRGFYDFYISKATNGLNNCFQWICSLNAEEQLLNYINLNNTDIIDLEDVGYPFTWIIGDIKNNFNWTLRHLKFNSYWQQQFKNYSNKSVASIFDIRKNLPYYNNTLIQKYSNNMKKIALLLSGQLRDFEFCIESIIEYVLPYCFVDIYISTQDAVCIKPRLGCGIYNQYIVLPLNNTNFDIIKNLIKKQNIRPMYNEYLNDQKTDLTFKTLNGPSEVKKDIRINLDMALESNIDYDFYLHIRPDILIGKPLNKINVNSVYGNDQIMILDKQNAINYPNVNLTKIDCFLSHPLKWLISDINLDKKKRHYLYGRKWSQKVEHYAKDFYPCIFDIMIA